MCVDLENDKKLYSKLEEMLNEAKSNFSNKLKSKIRYNSVGTEITLMWEYFNAPTKVKTEKDFFIDLQEEIHKSDLEIVRVAKFCESNNITFAFKLCKSKRLQNHENIPILLTSYISVGFPANDYYLNKEHEDIPDSVEEFVFRKENGLYDRIDLEAHKQDSRLSNIQTTATEE